MRDLDGDRAWGLGSVLVLVAWVGLGAACHHDTSASTGTGGHAGNTAVGSGGTGVGSGGVNGASGGSGSPAGHDGSGTGGVATGGSGTGGDAAPGTGGAKSGSGGTETGGATASGGTTMPGSGGFGGSGGKGDNTASGGVSGTGGNLATGDPVVHLDQPHQTMDGFGIADFFSYTALSDAQADQLFDPTRGLGLSILRIAMGTDGSAFSSNSYSDIKKAQARGVQTFVGTVLTAPAKCKDNSNVNDGGHLLTSCYDSWSDTIAAFPSVVKKNAGVDLYGMSPANQPDFASCGTTAPCNGDFPTMLYTATELVNFIDLVGPKLHAASPNIKVLSPETAEWLHLWTNDSAPGSTDPLKGTSYDYGHALFEDAPAWAQVDVVATQQYDTQVAQPWPPGVPAKPLWMTEMAGIKYWPEAGPTSDMANAAVVAGWIHDAIVNGPASAWLWLELQALSTDDNEGLILKDGTQTKRFYALGNFSRFIRPGYTRVDVSGSVPAGVLLSAYQGADGTVVVMAINKGSASATVPISFAGGAPPASLMPWLTSATDALAQKTTLPVSASGFTATLASLTVTTFVGK